MLKFNTEAALPGDIVQVRSDHFYGRGIRAVLGSYTNHTAMLVKATEETIQFLEKLGLLKPGHGIKPGDWVVGEAISPKSTFTSLADYEEKMNIRLDTEGWMIVRVLRFPDLPMNEREQVAEYYADQKMGLKYPVGVLRLWMYRFLNSIPYTVKGDWCTRIVWDAYCTLDRRIWVPPTGKRKKNPTPRTIENRLVAGVIKDVTDEVIIDV